MSVTASSSAAIVSFPEPAKQPEPQVGFARASKAWLKLVTGHPKLTDGEARVGTALYTRFNSEHYKDTGELVAWPEQKTLMALSTKSKSTVKYAIQKFEDLGLLDVERGYDHAAKKRTVNVYHVPPRAMQMALAPDQGPKARAKTKGQNQGPATWPIRGDIEEVNLEEVSLRRERDLKSGFPMGPSAPEEAKESGLPRKQGKQSKQAGPAAPSDSPLKSFLPKSMNGGPRGGWDPRETAKDRATLERYRKAAAANGGGQ